MKKDKYEELSLNEVQSAVKKLGGTLGVKRFLSGETYIKAIPKSFEVWKTVSIGNYASVENLSEVLKAAECEIGEGHQHSNRMIRFYSNEMIHSKGFTLTTKKEDIDLVVVTPPDLGFKDGGTRKEIYAWAKEIGLELCPHEVAIQLLLFPRCDGKQKYKDLRIAMKHITLLEEDGSLDRLVFRLWNWDAFHWDDSFEFGLLDNGGADYFCEFVNMVFCLPRKK